MQVEWVSLLRFRSYESLEWAPEPGVNLLIGPNGSGKTNLLEAVAYLARLASFRGAPPEALVTEGSQAAVVRSEVATTAGRHLIEVEIPRQGARRAQVDKKKLRRSTDLAEAFRVVTFLPEDLDLIKRGPMQRREFLDEVAVQLWPTVHGDQVELERSLRQRNAFLKSGSRDEVTLSVWDTRLAQAGGRVIARRSRVIEALGPLLEEYYRDIAHENKEATFTYTGSWGEWRPEAAPASEYAHAIAAALQAARAVDYERKMTTVGPHRDDPGFAIDGRSVRTHGSQGEQRTVALAVKLAAHQAIAGAVGEAPVLLLDDVFSELDPQRGSALAKSLPSGTQTLITSARREDIPVGGALWNVGPGVWR